MWGGCARRQSVATGSMVSLTFHWSGSRGDNGQFEKFPDDIRLGSKECAARLAFMLRHSDGIARSTSASGRLWVQSMVVVAGGGKGDVRNAGHPLAKPLFGCQSWGNVEIRCFRPGPMLVRTCRVGNKWDSTAAIFICGSGKIIRMPVITCPRKIPPHSRRSPGNGILICEVVFYAFSKEKEAEVSERTIFKRQLIIGSVYIGAGGA